MWDMPEHFPMPVNADGDGPCSIEELDRVICWCSDPDCKKHLELDEPCPTPQSQTQRRSCHEQSRV